MNNLDRQRKSLFLKMSESAMKQNPKRKLGNKVIKKSTIKPRKGCGGCQRKRSKHK